MKRLLLDTSGYSEFMRGHTAAKDLLQRADVIVMTPVVLGELHAGFRKGSHRVKNERELGLFLNSPRVSIIVMDEETSETYAVILTDLRKAGTPIPTNDLWISASAMQHGLTVLTRDGDFARVRQIRSMQLTADGNVTGP